MDNKTMIPPDLEKFLNQDDDDDEEEEEEGEEQKEVEDELTTLYNQEIEQCFAIFDKNKSGMIDTRYTEKALQALGIHLSFLELEEVIDTLDTEGVIFFDQFQPLILEKMFQLDDFEALREAFQIFDPENDGYISGERLKRSVMRLGDPLQEKEAKELVKMGDKRNKGLVDYELLAKVLLS